MYSPNITDCAVSLNNRNTPKQVVEVVELEQLLSCSHASFQRGLQDAAVLLANAQVVNVVRFGLIPKAADRITLARVTNNLLTPARLLKILAASSSLPG